MCLAVRPAEELCILTYANLGGAPPMSFRFQNPHCRSETPDSCGFCCAARMSSEYPKMYLDDHSSSRRKDSVALVGFHCVRVKYFQEQHVVNSGNGLV